MAFTNLLRMSHVDKNTQHNRYPVHVYGDLNTKQERQEVWKQYIPYLDQQLKQSIEQGESPKIQLFIRALGNIAHPKILQVFEPYLEGQKQITEYQRTLIVVSLDKLSHLFPRETRPVLYKIYQNQAEVYQVRVAAVYNLMKTNPPPSMLQRMAESTHEDVSTQVRSAVKSAIQSAASLSAPEHAER